MQPDEPSAAPTRPDRRYLTVTVAILAAVIALVGALLAAFAGRQISRESAATDLRKQVLGAASQIALNFAAYDYRHLAADFKRVADESTGQFHTQYVSQSAQAASLIIKAKAVSTAEVAGAGVSSLAAGKATVVVALNRTITNSSAPSGQNNSFGVQMTLLRQHGRWLASEVTPL